LKITVGSLINQNKELTLREEQWQIQQGILQNRKYDSAIYLGTCSEVSAKSFTLLVPGSDSSAKD